MYFRLTRVNLLICLLVSLCGLTLSQTPAVRDDVSKALYAVGFKSLWQFDHSRSYRLQGDEKTVPVTGKSPRPILINIWYPARTTAKAAPMLHRGYLDIESSDLRLQQFSRKLADYNRTIIATELFRKPAKDLTAQEKLLLEEALNSPTTAIRNAAHQPGRFPLIIYHSGAGSSFEDNAAFCEFMAGHGYVVINSAYQKNDGSSLNVDGSDASMADIRFLISYAQKLPNVNWDKIGTIGHSRGAQAIIKFQAENNSVVDALVSLDTTQDSRPLSMPIWNDMTEPVTKNIKNMSVPSLVAAGKHVIFQMWDMLEYSERYYLTNGHLGHNDFISQGLIQKSLSVKNTAKEPGKDSSENTTPAQLEIARRENAILNRSVLHFFNAFLRDDKQGKDFLQSGLRETPSDPLASQIEYMPKGATSAPKYDINSSVPPSPRQIRDLLSTVGTEKTSDLIRKFWTKNSPLPIYDHDFSINLVTELLDKEKNDDARAIYNLYGEFDKQSRPFLIRVFMSYGEFFPKHAEYFFKKVIILEPGNTKAAEKLKQLELKDVKHN